MPAGPAAFLLSKGRMPLEPTPAGHRWDLTPEEARAVQVALRDQVRVEPLPVDQVKAVAGIDASFGEGKVFAGAVLLDFPGLEILVQAVTRSPVTFPYIPGLLSFREAPASLEAVARLNPQPDVLIIDGHGYAHPRRFGIACHLGVLSELPSIGCAKSILVGQAGDLGEEAGSTVELRAGDEILGLAVRTRAGAKPVYVSAGHKVNLDSAIELVLACTRGYRLPEPARLAHRLVTLHRKGASGKD
jgi:deoxyribonuclease V